jgi:hypothetical protein
MVARMLVEPGTQKSRKETRAGINGAVEVALLLSVAIVQRNEETSRPRMFSQMPDRLIDTNRGAP